MTDSTITKTAFFAAPAETVWSFLTDKDKLGRWFHPARADLEQGQDLALVSAKPGGDAEPICWDAVLSAEPPNRLVYSFTVKPLAGVMTKVTWLLNEVQGGTRLTLIHEGLDKATQSPLGLILALDKGWDEHLAGLRQAVAG